MSTNFIIVDHVIIDDIGNYLEECSKLFDIIDFLSYKSIRSLSCTNHSISRESASDIIWKKILYSNIIDEFKDYEVKIEQEIRDKLERFFGCKKVALAVRSNTCSSCGKYSSNLNLLDCSRVCFDCLNEGSHGIDSKSPFALCTTDYAKTHYLLSDSDISSQLFVWSLNEHKDYKYDYDDEDYYYSHSECWKLLSDKIQIVLQKKAKALAHEIFGGEEGLEAEKVARAEKSEKKWIDECEEAEKNGKSVPEMPDLVQRENIDVSIVCANCNILVNSKRYGFYLDIYGTKSLEDVSPTAAPTIIVTDATDEMLRTRYPGYEITRFMPPSAAAAQATTAAVTLTSSLPKLEVHENLVRAFVSAKQYTLASIVVDKKCDITEMKKAAGDIDDDPSYTPYLYDQYQKNTIVIRQPTRVIGTSNGSISSDYSIFWVIGPKNVHCNCNGDDEYYCGFDDDQKPQIGCKFHCENLRLDGYCRYCDFGNQSLS